MYNLMYLHAEGIRPSNGPKFRRFKRNENKIELTKFNLIYFFFERIKFMINIGFYEWRAFLVEKPERRNNWRRVYVGRRAKRPKTCFLQSEGKSIEMRNIRKFIKRVNMKAIGDLGKTRKGIVGDKKTLRIRKTRK
jgi:hypothetical protein